MLLLQNARIATEHSPELLEGDVLIVEGIIQNIGPNLAIPEGARVIDARGRILMPGMFDAHVHFHGYALQLQRVNLDGCRSLAEALGRDPILGAARSRRLLEILASGCCSRGRRSAVCRLP